MQLHDQYVRVRLTCGDEILPSPTLLAELDCRLHFGKLELYKGVFGVAIRVVPGEYLKGFFVPASRHKPARRFWK